MSFFYRIQVQVSCGPVGYLNIPACYMIDNGAEAYLNRLNRYNNPNRGGGKP